MTEAQPPALVDAPAPSDATRGRGVGRSRTCPSAATSVSTPITSPPYSQRLFTSFRNANQDGSCQLTSCAGLSAMAELY